MITRRDALKTTGLALGAAILMPRLIADAVAQSADTAALMQRVRSATSGSGRRMPSARSSNTPR